MANAKILVTGALGNVGTEVVHSLLQAGHPVRAGDLHPEAIRTKLGPYAEAVLLDFRRPTTFAQAVRGIEKMFLMRPPQISDVKKYLFPLIDAARAAGVRQVVFLSLIGIEQNKVVPHYKVEQYLRASGLDWTFLRCSFFMQNLNTTHRTEIRDRDEIFVPVGRAKTSFIDVRDIGAVAALALTKPGHENQAYDLTGAEALDYHQVADLFSQMLGRKITYRAPSTLGFLIRQLQMKTPLVFALVTTWLYTNTRSGMADRVSDEVTHLLGRPPIPIRQYLTDYCEYWMRPAD